MIHWLANEWRLPKNVKAFYTTRHGGESRAPYDSFNLGDHVGDEPAAVIKNREILFNKAKFSQEPCWLQQVHGDHVVYAAAKDQHQGVNNESMRPGPIADASYTDQSNVPLVIMTADCLPILLASNSKPWIAAIHGGWRSLVSGILDKTIGCYVGDVSELTAWLGPAISKTHFEVGEEVVAQFSTRFSFDVEPFVKRHVEGKGMLDLTAIVGQYLQLKGISVTQSHRCTYAEANDFFSYRRDGVCGRQASIIELSGE